MQKILILGIGNSQIDAIKYCKEYGLEVFACANSKNAPGKDLVDHFAVIDILNTDDISKYIEDNDINYIYSIGSDIAMPTIAKVSEKLQLPQFVTYKTASLCQNKQ